MTIRLDIHKDQFLSELAKHFTSIDIQENVIRSVDGVPCRIDFDERPVIQDHYRTCWFEVKATINNDVYICERIDSDLEMRITLSKIKRLIAKYKKLNATDGIQRALIERDTPLFQGTPFRLVRITSSDPEVILQANWCSLTTEQQIAIATAIRQITQPPLESILTRLDTSKPLKAKP